MILINISPLLQLNYPIIRWKDLMDLTINLPLISAIFHSLTIRLAEDSRITAIYNRGKSNRD